MYACVTASVVLIEFRKYVYCLEVGCKIQPFQLQEALSICSASFIIPPHSLKLASFCLFWSNKLMKV